MQRPRRKIVVSASVALAGAGCQWLTGAHERQVDPDQSANDGGSGGVSGNAGSLGASGVGDAGDSGGVLGAAGSSGTGGTDAATDRGDGSAAGGTAGSANTAASCAELAVNFGVQQDGVATIDRDGTGSEPPFEVFCTGMANRGGTLATEFLILPRNSTHGNPDSNFVTFGVDTQNPPRAGACHCPALTIDFSAVRLDLVRLRVLAYDRSFGSFRGDPACHAAVENQCCNGETTNFGEAASCVAQGDSSGTANIDLRGTPFHLAEVQLFEKLTADSAGSDEVSADRKVATVHGGGLGSGVAPIGGELPLAFDVFTDDCGVETPGSVFCGGSGPGPSCAPAAGCCDDGEGEPVCNTSNPSVCPTLGYRRELYCDDRADCSEGKVCCLANVGFSNRSTCKTTCLDNEVQMCNTCRECGAGKSCFKNACVAAP